MAGNEQTLPIQEDTAGGDQQVEDHPKSTMSFKSMEPYHTKSTHMHIYTMHMHMCAHTLTIHACAQELEMQGQPLIMLTEHGFQHSSSHL